MKGSCGTADFGRDAIAKAKAAVDATRRAMQGSDLELLGQQIDQLQRTQRMFKGVVARG